MNSTELCVDTPSRLDSFLSDKTGKSRTFVQSQIKEARVKVNGEVCKKPSHKVQVNDVILYCWAEETKLSHLEPTQGNLHILYEDEHILAINKSSGIIVHPGAGRREDTLVHHLLFYLGNSNFKNLSSERPGIVHRLDEGTTGVLLIAKTASTHEALSAMFKNRAIKKTYQAITFGKMNLSGTFDSPIGRDKKNRKKMSSNSQSPKSAITWWKSLARFQHFTHVELYPHTGRTHQLRVHLSENNYPIVGDPTYGKKLQKLSLLPEELVTQINELSHTLLHAHSLAFEHPHSKKPMEISAPLPEDFLSFLQLLKTQDLCPE